MITREQALDPANTEFWNMTTTNADGTPTRARRNGATQTWKSLSSAWRIPTKHGFLYTFYITQHAAHHWCLPANWAVESELFRGVTP